MTRTETSMRCPPTRMPPHRSRTSSSAGSPDGGGGSSDSGGRRPPAWGRRLATRCARGAARGWAPRARELGRDEPQAVASGRAGREREDELRHDERPDDAHPLARAQALAVLPVHAEPLLHELMHGAVAGGARSGASRSLTNVEAAHGAAARLDGVDRHAARLGVDAALEPEERQQRDLAARRAAPLVGPARATGSACAPR